MSCGSYYSSLDEPSQSEYLDDISTKMRCDRKKACPDAARSDPWLARYFLYAASHTKDDEKRKRLSLSPLNKVLLQR